MSVHGFSQSNVSAAFLHVFLVFHPVLETLSLGRERQGRWLVWCIQYHSSSFTRHICKVWLTSSETGTSGGLRWLASGSSPAQIAFPYEISKLLKNPTKIVVNHGSIFLWGCNYKYHTLEHTYIHYVALHYITLLYITLNDIHMSVCMYVCMYVFMYVFMYACISTYLFSKPLDTSWHLDFLQCHTSGILRPGRKPYCREWQAATSAWRGIWTGQSRSMGISGS